MFNNLEFTNRNGTCFKFNHNILHRVNYRFWLNMNIFLSICNDSRFIKILYFINIYHSVKCIDLVLTCIYSCYRNRIKCLFNCEVFLFFFFVLIFNILMIIILYSGFVFNDVLIEKKRNDFKLPDNFILEFI